MRVRNKLMAGYLLAAVLVSVSGIFGLYGTEMIVTLLQVKHEYLRSMVDSASKLTRDVKNAEVDLTVYLLLRDRSFKEQFFQHVADMNNELVFLDKSVEDPRAKKILEVIRSDTELVPPAGLALLESFEADVKTNGLFVPSDRTTSLTEKFLALTSRIRSNGIKLMELETDFLNRQEPITASVELGSYTKRLQGHLIAYLFLQDTKDRTKVFDRYQSLKDMTAILYERAGSPPARQIINEINTDLEQILPTLEDLLKANDGAVLKKGNPTPEDYEVQLRKIISLTDKIQDSGVALARLNVNLELAPRKQALEKARFVQIGILVVTVIPVMLGFILGYAAIRKANKLDESRSKLANLNDQLERRSNDLAIANERLKNEILEHKRAEKEKENLIVELQKALSEVKKLSGFLPICASCKKIRDDEGYWQQIESYIMDRSEAQFSHGICPDCARKLYPELFKD